MKGSLYWSKWSALKISVRICYESSVIIHGANKTVEKKAPKRCTFSPDDPKTSMELKLLGGNKNG